MPQASARRFCLHCRLEFCALLLPLPLANLHQVSPHVGYAIPNSHDCEHMG
jgi:hypothetical protein